MDKPYTCETCKYTTNNVDCYKKHLQMNAHLIDNESDNESNNESDDKSTDVVDHSDAIRQLTLMRQYSFKLVDEIARHCLIKENANKNIEEKSLNNESDDNNISDDVSDDNISNNNKPTNIDNTNNNNIGTIDHEEAMRQLTLMRNSSSKIANEIGRYCLIKENLNKKDSKSKKNSKI